MRQVHLQTEPIEDPKSEISHNLTACCELKELINAMLGFIIPPAQKKKEEEKKQWGKMQAGQFCQLYPLLLSHQQCLCNVHIQSI